MIRAWKINYVHTKTRKERASFWFRLLAGYLFLAWFSFWLFYRTFIESSWWALAYVPATLVYIFITTISPLLVAKRYVALDAITDKYKHLKTVEDEDGDA